MIRLALAQINSTVGDLESNKRKVLEFINKAGEWAADLVLFPELALCGYPAEDLLLKPHFLARNAEVLGEIAAKAFWPVSLLGYPRAVENRAYNSVAVLSGGRVRAVYNKTLLPNYGVFDERRYFHQGSDLVMLDYKCVVFGITVCEDLWEADGPCRDYGGGGAQVILNLSASPYHKGKMSLREEMLRTRAKESGVCVAYVNLVGGQDELVFDGGSLIVSPEGDILARGKRFAEDLVVCDLDVPARETQKEVPLIRIQSSQETAQKPRLTRQQWQELSEPEEVSRALLLGLRDYVKKNGFSKVILGLSGGIDSALTACIAVDALEAERVEALTMPSVFSSEETQNDARRLAKNLGVRLHRIPIDNVYDAYLRELRSAFAGRRCDVTEENIQARIRGNLLMAFSNKFGHLVLTTGNKSETSVGYCTLYGDTAGGFAVLKDCYKTLVYELARFVNEKAGEERIPETIIGRPPTAELKPDQRDEDSLPPYALLDRILELYIEEDRSAPRIISEGFDPRLVHRVVDLVDRNEYKRRQAPPGIRITPKAFGKDRRMPITNKSLLR